MGEVGAEEPVLCIELLSRQPRRALHAIRAELLEIGARQPDTQYIRALLFHKNFPVDIRHNAKIGRRQLRAKPLARSEREHVASVERRILKSRIRWRPRG